MKQFKVFEYNVIIAFLAIKTRTGRAQNIFYENFIIFTFKFCFDRRLNSCPVGEKQIV